MAEHMTKCKWWGCEDGADYTLIRGCFEQHINESPICVKHFQIWFQEYLARNVSCLQCGDTIKEYILITSCHVAASG